MIKKLYVDGDSFESEKIYRGKDFIKGDNFEFRGINDWSKFELEEGQEWDILEEDLLQQRIDELELFILMEGGLI